MEIHFSKYQGTGNDFIILDNRKGVYNLLTQADIANLCRRRFGIGADGLMMLGNAEGFDFEMKYFNADGAPGSMCGNGGRCIAAFAFSLGASKDFCRFMAFDGPHEARIHHGDLVSLKMNPVNEIREDAKGLFLDTGSPHVITFLTNVEGADVVGKGRRIRNSPKYRKTGVNVNFVEKIAGDIIRVRTYERGVEDETYSCGTGVTAAAIAFAASEEGEQHISVQTKGGNLSVLLKKTATGYDDIWLIGPADFVYSGKVKLAGK